VVLDQAPGSGTGAFHGLVSRYQSERDDGKDDENDDEGFEERAAQYIRSLYVCFNNIYSLVA